MSIIENFLTRGHSFTRKNTLGGKIACKLGYRLATRSKNTQIDKSSGISPNALINSRGHNLKIGKNCVISTGAQIQGNIDIGDDSSVQAYSVLVGYKDGQIKIGNGVRIAPHCMIIAANHIFSDTSKPIHKQGLEGKDIKIEDDVWIGGNVNITAGVTIGSGSVIGAGSVVTKNIPPMSIAVGAPAKVIKTRF
jgi:acetyltransferase-like isoleucine patch superfamily enzyme